MGFLMRVVFSSVIFMIMSSIGHDANTWQYWAVFICLIIFGTAYLFDK